MGSQCSLLQSCRGWRDMKLLSRDSPHQMAEYKVLSSSPFASFWDISECLKISLPEEFAGPLLQPYWTSGLPSPAFSWFQWWFWKHCMPLRDFCLTSCSRKVLLVNMKTSCQCCWLYIHNRKLAIKNIFKMF